ncbi:hypothetical protein BH23ACT10_BH23ACT10_32140 [soil metagenome]
MRRTTVVADGELMERLREVAHSEGVSLAEVIRQGMRWRAHRGGRLRLVGAVHSDEPTAIVGEAEHLEPAPHPWR